MIKTWNDNFADTQLEEFFKILKGNLVILHFIKTIL
jgi:hypothetical protein